MTLFLSAFCDSDDDSDYESSSSACTFNYTLSSSTFIYCQNDIDEETCNDLMGSQDWVSGKTCEDLGYTVDCGNNEWYQSGHTCS
jgi:hypothetical protein